MQSNFTLQWKINYQKIASLVQNQAVLLCPVLESYTMSLRKMTPNLDFKSQRHKPYSPKIMKYWKD